MPAEPTDQELVIRLKTGDLTALAALDQRYRVRIIRLIARLAQSYEEAEDIYQEAIFKAFSHIDSFDDRRSFYNWLHRIARNQYIDVHRRKCNRTQVVKDERMLLTLPGHQRDALDEISDRELQENLQRAIDALPKRQQSVAKLRLLEGLEYREIAQRIGGSVQTVKSLFTVARKTLKTRLQLYLSGFAFFRSEAPGASTMQVSGLISVAAHLAVAFVVCWLPMRQADIGDSLRSEGTNVVLLSHIVEARRPLEPLKRLQSGIPATKETSSVEPVRVERLPLHRQTLPVKPVDSVYIAEGVSNLTQSTPEVHLSASLLLSRAMSAGVHQDSSTTLEAQYTLAKQGTGLERAQSWPLIRFPDTLFSAEPPSMPAVSAKPLQALPRSAQATLSTIGAAFLRLRAYQHAQKLDASLAQLRIVAREQGRHPLLISHCGENELHILLKHGWTPIVVLRSPVGGKHLWAITEWRVDADQITMANPLEQHEITMGSRDFMRAWQTGSAPSTCLLVSDSPFPKPFQLLNTSRTKGGVRVWY
jgi:RNA polymerase sigma-70 factor (ECF subfamily)